MKSIDDSFHTSSEPGTIIAGHFDESDDYAVKRPQGMEDCLIVYTLGGEGYFTVAGEKRVCSQGDLTLLQANTPHQYGTSKGETWHFVWAHFSPFLFDSYLMPESSLTVQPIQSEVVRQRVYEAFRRVIQDVRERSEYWHQLCRNALQEVLLLLAERTGLRIDPRVEQVQYLLSKHMKEPVRIEELAHTIGLSPSRLSHLFKECTGYSIIELLNRMRLQQAALLFEHTERNASEVALDVGFSNYNHFASLFVKRFHMSPSAYRKKYSGLINSR